MEDIIGRYAILQRQYIFATKYLKFFRNTDMPDDILYHQIQAEFWEDAAECGFAMKSSLDARAMQLLEQSLNTRLAFKRVTDLDTLSQLILKKFRHITHGTNKNLLTKYDRRWFHDAFLRMRRLVQQERDAIIEEAAASSGFSVEYDDDPFGFYTLDYNEFALLCNRCREHVILKYDEPALLKKIQTLECPDAECGLEKDVLEWTTLGEMAWCCDLLHAISSVDVTPVNKITFDNDAHLSIPEDGEREVYFALDPTDSKYAYAFIVYTDEDDEWQTKYLLIQFAISTWGKAPMEVSIHVKWPYFYQSLYKAIKQDIAIGRNRDPHKTAGTFNGYLAAYNAIHKLNYTVWAATRLVRALEGLSECLDRLIDDSTLVHECQDIDFYKFLKTHTCPVCKKPFGDSETACMECHFPELNRVFVNKEDAEYWKTHILLPYKQNYEKND